MGLSPSAKRPLALADCEELSVAVDHERLGEYADRLVSAVEHGDPETVAMLLRRQSRSAS